MKSNQMRAYARVPAAGYKDYGFMAKKRKRKKRPAQKGLEIKTSLIAGMAFFIVLMSALIFVLYYFRVRTYMVSGTSRFTDEEVISMVISSPLEENTLYLNWKYSDSGITDYPFIEKIEVKPVSHDSVRITVYEKALAGYIYYLGQYMYFDREGIIIEVSGELLSGVPQVLGLDFDYLVLNEKLPVANEEIFNRVLSITQLLQKYSLSADRIFFDAKYNTYLYFGQLECDLGEYIYIEEKLEQIVNILPELDGKSGILRMKDYTPLSNSVTFEER